MRTATMLIVALLLTGCNFPRFGGARTTRPMAKMNITRQYDEAGKIKEETITKEATGAGSSNVSDFAAGELSIDGDTVTVGGMAFKVKLPKVANKALIWGGIGLIVLGVLVFGWFCRSWTLAAITGVLGASLIGLAYYPWIAGAAAGAALLGGMGYIVYAMRRKVKAEHTSATLYTAICESADEIEDTVMGKFRQKAENHPLKVSHEVDRLKKKRVQA